MKDLVTRAQSLWGGARAGCAAASPGKAATPSFREVYEREVSYVGRVLVRFGVPRRDLDDLVQEVFLVLHRRRADYDPARPLRPWLCGIAFRVASDWRRRAFQREVPGELCEEPARGSAPDEKVAAHLAVQRGLAALSFEQRATFVLCDLEGYTAPEAGALLAVPAGTIYSRLHEARRAFAAAVRAPEEEAA